MINHVCFNWIRFYCCTSVWNKETPRFYRYSNFKKTLKWLSSIWNVSVLKNEYMLRKQRKKHFKHIVSIFDLATQWIYFEIPCVFQCHLISRQFDQIRALHLSKTNLNSARKMVKERQYFHFNGKNLGTTLISYFWFA